MFHTVPALCLLYCDCVSELYLHSVYCTVTVYCTVPALFVLYCNCTLYCNCAVHAICVSPEHDFSRDINRDES